MSREPFALSAIQLDRAIGALLGTVAGDALGADRTLFAPGQWTDDTALAIAVAETATYANDLCALQRQDELLQRWQWWAQHATAIGPQTVAALTAAGPEINHRNAPKAAAALYAETGTTLDGTCLTRTAPVALGNLSPKGEHATGLAARTLCRLTHGGPDAADAATLWALAIRHAVLTGHLDVRVGLPRIDEDRRELWESRIAEAERSRPGDFAHDTPVGVFQAAWSAIVTTAVPHDDPRSGVFAVDHLRLALETAVRGGGNTATVAAVAGALLGAAYGVTAIPWHWRLDLRGGPGLNTHLLIKLAEKILNGGEQLDRESTGFWRERPAPQRHPHDEGVWIGEGAWLEHLPQGVDTVVSLCPVADGEIPAGVRHLDVRLSDDAEANPNLDFVLLDTVRAIEDLRAQGATVFLHGLRTHSRAPAVAALYGARQAGIEVDRALAEVCAVLIDADPAPGFHAALHRLHPVTERTSR